MDLEEFMRHWPYQKIDGKSFSELTLDGIPLWWFHNRFFLGHVMPRQLNTFESIKSNRKLSLLEMAKLSISVLSRKYLVMKERRKIKFLKKTPNITRQKKVLFLTYTNHVSDGKLYRIQGIIDKVKERGNIKDFVVFADPLSSSRYTLLKDRCSIYQYCTDNIMEKAKKEAQELHKQWKQISVEQKQRMLEWNGISLWYYFKYAFNFFFSKEFLYVTSLYYHIFLDMLLKENVKVVLITSQNSIFEKCLIAAANKLKINVLRLQHGIGEEIVAPEPFDVQNEYFYKLMFSDYLRREAMAVGWPKKKLVVVGCVVFDHIAKYIGAKHRDTNTILLATIPAVQSNLISESEYLRRMKVILKEMKKTDMNLVIKLHPREVPKERCMNNYQKLLDDLGCKGSVFGGDVLEEKFYELMKSSDLMANFGSTVAVEAMIIDRPTMTIDLLGSKFHTRWIEEKGITVNVDWDGDIVSAVKTALAGNKEIQRKSKKYIKNKCGKITGKAYENVAKMIEAMSR